MKNGTVLDRWSKLAGASSEGVRLKDAEKAETPYGPDPMDSVRLLAYYTGPLPRDYNATSTSASPSRITARNVTFGVVLTCVGPGEGGRSVPYPSGSRATPTRVAETSAPYYCWDH
jgi:hypothetical protein